jgi:phosphoglycerate kinase
MKGLEDLEVKGRTVFVRVDFNVPQDEAGRVRDDTRIRASLPTLNYLLEHGAKLVLASHLGRPKGVDPRFSLKSVGEKLSELLGRKVIQSPEVVGPEASRLKKGLREGDVLLLENVRFQPGETKNDPALAKELAEGIDLYVNDAFGSSHRAHATIVGLPPLVKDSAAGFLLKKEVENLSRALHDPAQPYVAILGGAKVSDKIGVITALLGKARHILIGGAMAYTFFKAQGLGVGRSLVEDDKLGLAAEVLEKARRLGVDLKLPLDHVLAPSIDAPLPSRTVETFPLPDDLMAVDIGPKTVGEYSAVISRAKTIFWNGPLGVFEQKPFSAGTFRVAEAVAASTAVSIVGGGDSVSAIRKAGLANKITHISTGGGASLEFLADGTLPGLEALGWKKK